LDKLLDAAKKARDMSKKGIQATEDLIYPFVPLFLLGMLSFFTAFWRREDSGEARDLLRGVVLGLLIANVAMAMLVHFIPVAIEAVATALPKELIQVHVNINTGWEWMQYSVYSSVCSAAFWGVAFLLGQKKDDCDQYLGEGKRTAKIQPIEDVKLKNVTTLALPKWTGKGYHPKFPNDEIERVKAPSARVNKIHPFLDTLLPLFDGSNGTKRTTAWINNFIWFLPVIFIIFYSFNENLKVFNIEAKVVEEIHEAMESMFSEEGAQEFVQSTDDGISTPCQIVEVAVKSLLSAAGNAVGKAIGPAVSIVREWFVVAFFELRNLASAMFSIPDIASEIWWMVDNSLLIVAFAAPICATVLSVIGLVLALIPLPEYFYDWVRLDILRSLQYMLAIGGLSIAFTMYGMSATIAAVPIPIFDIRISTTHVLLHAALANVIILMNFFNNVFNSVVPLYDLKDD